MNAYSIITEKAYQKFNGQKFTCLYFKKDGVLIADQTRNTNSLIDTSSGKKQANNILKNILKYTNSNKDEYVIYFKTDWDFFKECPIPQTIQMVVCDSFSSDFFMSLHKTVHGIPIEDYKSFFEGFENGILDIMNDQSFDYEVKQSKEA